MEANLNSPSGSEAKLRSSCLPVCFQTAASPALSRQLNNLKEKSEWFFTIVLEPVFQYKCSI